MLLTNIVEFFNQKMIAIELLMSGNIPQAIYFYELCSVLYVKIYVLTSTIHVQRTVNLDRSMAQRTWYICATLHPFTFIRYINGTSCVGTHNFYYKKYIRCYSTLAG